MLNKIKLDELNKDFLINQLETLKEQYEFYTLNLLNTQIDNITENYFNAKTLTKVIEAINDIENKLKEKEEGEKENGKTKLNA